MFIRGVQVMVFLGFLVLVPCMSFSGGQRGDVVGDARTQTVVEDILKAAKAEIDADRARYAHIADGLAMDQAVGDVAARHARWIRRSFTPGVGNETVRCAAVAACGGNPGFCAHQNGFGFCLPA